MDFLLEVGFACLDALELLLHVSVLLVTWFFDRGVVRDAGRKHWFGASSAGLAAGGEAGGGEGLVLSRSASLAAGGEAGGGEGLVLARSGDAVGGIDKGP